MKRDRELERELSSSASELESEFSGRLRQLIGTRPLLQFAKKSGISDSLIRKYLRGSLPGMDNLIALADAGGVRVGWLATGEPPMRAGEAPESLGKQGADMDALEDVAVKVLALLDQKRPDLSAKARGRIVRLVYEFYIRQEKPMDEASLNNVIELAAFR